MNNIKLQYTGSIKKVNFAVNKANEILSSEEFYRTIKSYPRFDNSSLSPEIIAELMAESGQQIKVTVNWIIPIVKMGHDKIGLSGWDFSNDLGKGVNTLIYETVYCVDCLYDVINRNEKSRDPGTRTAPLLIASMAEGIVLGDKKTRTLIQL